MDAAHKVTLDEPVTQHMHQKYTTLRPGQTVE